MKKREKIALLNTLPVTYSEGGDGFSVYVDVNDQTIDVFKQLGKEADWIDFRASDDLGFFESPSIDTVEIAYECGADWYDGDKWIVANIFQKMHVALVRFFMRLQGKNYEF